MDREETSSFYEEQIEVNYETLFLDTLMGAKPVFYFSHN